MTTLIKNGNLINGYNNEAIFGELCIENGRICAPKSSYDRVIDAKGAYIMPGLIDIHIHGAAGINFSECIDFSPALDFCAKNGITTILPTIGVRPMDELLSAIHNVNSQIEKSKAATIGGIHLEGPFVNENKKGAMNTPDIPCTVNNLDKILSAGCVRVMTIAPERENACAVISRGTKSGVRMSIGHTEADNETAVSAIDAGATGATHVFNAMNALNHRAPGVLGAALTDDRISCEVICDLIHIHPTIIELIRRCKGIDKMILVSDSGMITGLGDGEFLVDGKLRIAKNKIVRNQEGKLAGSCYSMADAARGLLKLGFTLSDIAHIGAQNPAKAAGLEKDFGSLEVGKFANMIFCDNEFNIKEVYIKGEKYV